MDWYKKYYITESEAAYNDRVEARKKVNQGSYVESTIDMYCEYYGFYKDNEDGKAYLQSIVEYLKEQHGIDVVEIYKERTRKEKINVALRNDKIANLFADDEPAS